MECTLKETIVQELIKRIATADRITLDVAKELIESVEQEASRRNLNMVIAVCGADGHMVAVHVMDGALLVSFDMAIKKAYTSVAIRSATKELNKAAAPGGQLWGLNGDSRLVVIGGGIPIIYQDKVIGGVGVSGGTPDEDHELAAFGIAALKL